VVCCRPGLLAQALEKRAQALGFVDKLLQWEMTQADLPEGLVVEAQGAPLPPADKAPCTAENNVDSTKGDTYARGKSMEWTGVSLTIKDKKILEGISGNVNGGEMTCILGPSGAGKSTLLNILAGRMNTKARAMTFSGGVSIGGCIVDPVAVRSTIGYVMQEDAMPAMSTPREILAMSCVLRGSERGSQAVQGRVDSLLAALRLEKCADTRVGNALVKGLSGGEKKRTAVALELITSPSMLFLDEPLSGLDSYAAYMVVQVLKELSSKGCAVLCTIHQPSSEIFQMFNKLICLSDGKTCYCDAVSRLMEHMESIGSPVPNNFNPADHILFYVQTQSKEQIAEFTETWAQKEKKSTLQQIEDLRSASSANKAAVASNKGKNCFLQLGFLVGKPYIYTQPPDLGLEKMRKWLVYAIPSRICKLAQNTTVCKYTTTGVVFSFFLHIHEEIVYTSHFLIFSSHKHGDSVYIWCPYLVQRETRQIYRDKVGLVMRFVVNAVMGTVFAFIFMDIGSKGNRIVVNGV